MTDRHLSIVSPPPYEYISTLTAEFGGSVTSNKGETTVKFMVDPDSQIAVAELAKYAGLMLKVDLHIIAQIPGEKNFQPVDLPDADMSEFIE